MSIPTAKPEQRPLFSFGVIADVQWADTEDGSNYDKTVLRRYHAHSMRTPRTCHAHAIGTPCARHHATCHAMRRYRGAFRTLERAVDWWNLLLEPPTFIAQLGDIIDGVNVDLGQSDSALEARACKTMHSYHAHAAQMQMPCRAHARATQMPCT